MTVAAINGFASRTRRRSVVSGSTTGSGATDRAHPCSSGTDSSGQLRVAQRRAESPKQDARCSSRTCADTVTPINRRARPATRRRARREFAPSSPISASAQESRSHWPLSTWVHRLHCSGRPNTPTRSPDCCTSRSPCFCRRSSRTSSRSTRWPWSAGRCGGGSCRTRRTPPSVSSSAMSARS